MIKIAFSFDDGIKNNYRVYKDILLKNNIPASFNITTGYILNDISDDEKPTSQEAMSLDELKNIQKSGLIELAGHGYSHNNDENNLIKGVEKLRELLKTKEIVGIASPHSQFNQNNVIEFEKKCKNNGIKYLRISHRFEKNAYLRRIVRRINRIIGNNTLFNWVYKFSDVKENDKFLLHSVPIIKDTKLKEVKSLIDYAIKNNKSYILMFHSILKENEPYYDDLFNWDYNDFFMLCIYLKELEDKNIIKICKVKDIIKNN